MMIRHPEIDGSTNSGIYVGYEEEQTKNFYWIAMHEPNYQTFNETT